MTWERHWERAVRARLEPDSEDFIDTLAPQGPAPQSGHRWLEADEHATEPRWSLIQRAIAVTDPETATVVARKAAEEILTRKLAVYRTKQSDWRAAGVIALGLVVLVLWLWMLALLPIAWVK